MLYPPVYLLFGSEETELAVNFLEDFTKVPRFDMIIMCLSSADRNGMVLKLYS